jgi:RHS repeat-associated protein
MIFSRFKAGGREGSDSYDVLADPTGDGILSGTDAQLALADFKAGQRCTSTGPNTGNAHSTYNGDGLRVGLRTFPGGTTTDDAFVWDQGASLPEILQDTQTQNGVSATTTYLYGLDGIIADTDGPGTTHYHLQDGLGSTTQLANTSGTVTDSYTYDAFGAITSHTGTNQQPFGFTGQQQDTNAARGLLYLRARSYDPALGRFVSQDPLPFMQRYAYAGSEPVNLVDPSGNFGPGDFIHGAKRVVQGSIRVLNGPVGTAIQVADLVPWQPICTVGGGLIGTSLAGPEGGFAGAVIGYQVCGRLDQALNAGAAVSSQIQILESGCGLKRESAATALNIVNFALDIKNRELQFIGEAGAFVGQTGLTACNSAQRLSSSEIS